MTCTECLALIRDKDPGDCTHAEFVAVCNHAMRCKSCRRKVEDEAQRASEKMTAEEKAAARANGRRLACEHFARNDPEALPGGQA